MSVIEVARDRAGRQSGAERRVPQATHGQSDSSVPAQAYDIASVWTDRLERWLTRALPVEQRIVLDWSTLSPMMSVLSGAVVTVFTLWQVMG